MSVLILATVNIDGFRAPTRVGIFTEFLRHHDIDILFVQEVTNVEVLQTRGYQTHQNIGKSMCGTAILTKYGISS
jgi:exonuclease III